MRGNNRDPERSIQLSNDRMRGDFLTGHEPHFDFPRFAGEPRPYLLATVPRSGSSYVANLLWQTGCLGAPLEYINFLPEGPLGDAHGSPSRQVEMWREVLHTRTSPNDIFGIKAFPNQLAALQQGNPRLLDAIVRFLLARGDETRVIHLMRRDREAHAISLARASLSGVWRKVQEKDNTEEPEFSANALAWAKREIDAQERIWEAMFRDLRIDPLTIWYEDVLADEQGALARVADYLGVTLDLENTVAIPPVERQSQDGAKAWREKLERSSDRP